MSFPRIPSSTIPKTKQPNNKQKTNQAKHNIKNKIIDKNKDKSLVFNNPILQIHNPNK